MTSLLTPLSYLVDVWTSRWSWSSVVASAGSERLGIEGSKLGEVSAGVFRVMKQDKSQMDSVD